MFVVKWVLWQSMAENGNPIPFGEATQPHRVNPQKTGKMVFLVFFSKSMCVCARTPYPYPFTHYYFFRVDFKKNTKNTNSVKKDVVNTANSGLCANGIRVAFCDKHYHNFGPMDPNLSDTP